VTASAGKKGIGVHKAKRSTFALGLTFALVALVVGVGLFQKDRITTALRPGEAIKINFDRDYRLRPFASQVKVAGIPIGVVTAVDSAVDGSAVVSVKVDSDVPAKLGSAPSAVIRATTLLGGNYYVDLVPGGLHTSFNGEISKDRTKVPVELDEVTAALPPQTLDSAKSAVEQLDKTLDVKGRTAIDQLLADAPGALEPATDVLGAARGTRPDTDLPNLVGGLESAAVALTQQQGQLDSIVQNLNTTSTVLGGHADDLARTIADLPATLDSTNAGLTRLDTTLGKLRDTADPARPVVQQLNTALQHTDPVLVKARPLVGRLKDLLIDARPLVQDLVPASQQATSVLDDVRGPVLDRLNGPVKKTVLSPYQGSGPYAGADSDKPLYQELGHMLANLDRATALTDANGATLAYEPGIGPGTVAGMPVSLEQLFSNLTKLGQHQEG
jgi:phospholipid/cholesterol/gamma-HCH transport system substrate-binding protein